MNETLNCYLIHFAAVRFRRAGVQPVTEVGSEAMIIAAPTEEVAKSRATEEALRLRPDNEGWWRKVGCTLLSLASVKQVSKLCDVVLLNSGSTEPRVLSFSTGQRITTEETSSDDPDSAA